MIEWDKGKITAVTHSQTSGDLIGMPALIDVHTHGFRGFSSEAPAEDLRRLAQAYAQRGIGGFCATIGPRPFPRYLEIIAEYRKAFSTPYPGARFLGLHLEGPYLNPAKAGAIDPVTMQKIDLTELEAFLKQSAGCVKIMTIAPELPDAVKKALPAVECALDVVMDGTKFDATNGKSFWNVMARYLSRSNSSDDDGTFTVTKDQVLDAAKSVFSGITELPDVPENSSVVTLVPSEEEGGEDQYQLLWGATGGHDLEVTAYEDGVMTVLVDGDKTYQVTLDDSGAIVSVKEA